MAIAALPEATSTEAKAISAQFMRRGKLAPEQGAMVDWSRAGSYVQLWLLVQRVHTELPWHRGVVLARRRQASGIMRDGRSSRARQWKAARGLASGITHDRRSSRSLKEQCAEYTQSLLSSAPSGPSHHGASHGWSGSRHRYRPWRRRPPSCRSWRAASTVPTRHRERSPQRGTSPAPAGTCSCPAGPKQEGMQRSLDAFKVLWCTRLALQCKFPFTNSR
jgi:hypothetical protein